MKDSNSPSSGKLKKVLGAVIGLAMLLAGLGMGAHLLVRGERFPSTDDAYVFARHISIAASAPGRITEVFVKNGDRVEAGDPLIRLETRDADLAVAEAEAQIAALEATKEEISRNREAALTEVEAARANVARIEAKLRLAEETRGRLQPMVERQFVSREKFDEILSDVDQARAGLEIARKEAEAAALAVPSVTAVEAEIEAARIVLEQARRERQRMVITAPFTGRTADCDLLPGRYVLPGEELFTLIDTQEWFVVANFREGDLRQVNNGQGARVRLMTAPDQDYRGEVVSTGWGVQTEDAFPLPSLPFVRSELDWVRLAQRFPVRIRIEEPVPVGAFRIGVSAVVRLDPRNTEK